MLWSASLLGSNARETLGAHHATAVKGALMQQAVHTQQPTHLLTHAGNCVPSRTMVMPTGCCM